MSYDHILNLLGELRLTGMAENLLRQLDSPAAYSDVSFCEQFGELVVGEADLRHHRRTQRLLKASRLRQHVTADMLTCDPARGFDKAMIAELRIGDWVGRGNNVLITGPTGAGKTYLASHLAYEVIRQGKSVLYYKTGPLLAELTAAHDDHSISKMQKFIEKHDVVFLDDFALTDSLTERAQEDLFDLLDNRTERKSTVFVGQRPADQWYGFIGKPRMADAIMDRIFYRSYRIQLAGDTMRPATR
jgi:DNA replication protein DnaC